MKMLALAILLLGATSVFAQGVAVQGVGTLSCGQYLELRAPDSQRRGAFTRGSSEALGRSSYDDHSYQIV